jgi:glycosyltransferase involved in cell wall biosynthesis
MRVVVIHNLPAGGAHRRLRSQIQYLDSQVIEVCLDSATPITDTAVVVPFRQLANRLPRRLRPPARYLDMAVIEAAWRRLARRVADLTPDALYVNPCRYLQTPPLPLSRLPPAVYFCDEPRRVDAEPEAAARRNQSTLRLYAPLYARERQLDRSTVSTVHTIATNSRYTAAEIRRVYGRAATVIPMGVAESLRSEPVPPPQGGGYVLSVGTLLPSKGHDLALTAAGASLTRPRVQIVAPRPNPSEQARLSQIAHELGIDVQFHVGVSDLELAGLYASAIGVLYLAEREPLGLVSLEAQACGCPVIVAAEGGLPETIVEDVTGWSCAREPRAAGALVDRLAEPAVRSRMSGAGREHAAKWTWRASASEVDKLLAAAADSGSASSS